MKIRIDKSTIVLGDVQEAKEMAISEGSWIDTDIIKYCASRILEKYYGKETYVESVIKAPELKITMNHYRMTVYADDAYIQYWNDGQKIAIISFDVLYNYNGNEPEAFLQIFGKSFSGCI